MGDGTPLARVYDLDGWMLLLGADYQCASSLHLAEHRANYPKKRVVRRGAPVEINGRREWVEYQDNDWDDSDFSAIGSAFEEDTRLVRSGRVANAVARLMPQKQFVDFAVRWIEKHRL